MLYIPTTPDLKPQIADTIRGRRKQASNINSYDRLGIDRNEAGRYTTVGGALVTVEAVMRSSEHRVWKGNVPNGYEQRVEVGAVAKCHGYGCTGHEFRKNDTGYFLLADDADETAQAALPYVQAAQEWAQAHAEKCRAQAYTTN
jgi:hypothetical protein